MASMKLTLPADVTRCHADECPERETCQRWVQRESGRVHAQHPLWTPDEDGKCVFRIWWNEKERRNDGA